MPKEDSSENPIRVQYQIGPKTTHVRHDPAHCLAPGLFRSLRRGARIKQKLHVIYKFGKKELLEFSGPEPLGADDLVVLQGLVAMAGPQKIILGPDEKSEKGIILRKRLDLKWDAVNHGTMVVKSSYRKLAREIGYNPDSGGDLKTIFKCIERLWKVSIIVQSGNRRRGYNMLSEYGSDDKEGKLYVALNCRVAEAVFGVIPHARINMDEVRALKGAHSRILHQRLSAIIAQGETKKILPDRLVSYIWPDPAKGSTHRMRLKTLRKSLQEIVKTGAWQIEPGYLIKRKGFPKQHRRIKKKKV